MLLISYFLLLYIAEYECHVSVCVCGVATFPANKKCCLIYSKLDYVKTERTKLIYMSSSYFPCQAP